jgi:hypothetical protein
VVRVIGGNPVRGEGSGLNAATGGDSGGPRRGAVDAVKEVHRHVCRGYTDVVDADLSRYFDSIQTTNF